MKPNKNPRPKNCHPKLNDLHRELSQRVKAQPEVSSRLSQALIRRETNSVPHRGMRGRFFFAGPTGTGKTFTAQCVAELLFGPDRLIIFDCSEFKMMGSVAALLGDRTGDSGRLGAAYAKVPTGVWIFDEIEKGHPDLPDLFLQMAWDGRVTLANGQTLDLSGIYLFVTSNLGSAEILGRENVPFTSLERHVTRRVQQHLRPEILARFGRPFVFRGLNREAQREIVEQNLERLLQWQKQQGRQITCEPGVVDFLARRGFSAKLGARPLLDVMEEQFGNAVAAKLLAGHSGSGRLAVRGDQLELI